MKNSLIYWESTQCGCNHSFSGRTSIFAGFRPRYYTAGRRRFEFIHSLLFGFCFLTLLIPTSCADDINITGDIPAKSSTSHLKTADIEGVFGVRITPSGTMSTRGDNSTSPSIDGSFNDGLEAEYRITETPDHHFLVYYDSAAGDNALPSVVIPLSLDHRENGAGGDIIDNEGNYTTYDNVTLIAGNVVSFNDILQRDDNGVSLGKQEFLDLIDDLTGYILVNFDQSIAATGTLTNSSPVTTGTNAEFLASITRKDFLDNMEVNDYKITLSDTDYFVMSTSVYASGGNLTYAYTNLNSMDYIYDSEEEALAGTPLISGYVERLAAKYTVAFDLTGYEKKAQYDGDGNPIPNQIFEAQMDEGSNTPVVELYINRYTGITYDNTGYTINSEPAHAAIKVVGVGFSNLEPTSRIMKKIANSKNYFSNLTNNQSWNDAGNSRSYWAEDSHYTLSAGTDKHKSAAGYPQQFRLALDTDTILSLHDGIYEWTAQETETVTGSDGSVSYIYNSLGTTENGLNESCYLTYKSFSEMMFPTSDGLKADERAYYTLENTYADPGMKDGDGNKGTWVWPWKKAAYGTATNIILLCQMVIRDNTTDENTPFYRGQNNIYYLSEREVLDSKLRIFNEVMLSGGNAFMQVLHAHWDTHLPHGTLNDYDEDYNNGTFLDRVAWNMNSVLWIHGPNPHNGNNVEYWKATADDLILIPAEISGGDGQRLIAPKLMGSQYSYHLAPEKADGTIDDDPIGEGQERSNKVVQINFNHLVALIHKIIGPIDVFTNGYMYYALPVPHNARGLNMEGTTPSWHTLGNIGVVRNNWYNITIKGVTDVGQPVDNIYQPIVPVMETKRSYINLGVKLIDWHTIKQIDVPIVNE